MLDIIAFAILLMGGDSGEMLWICGVPVPVVKGGSNLKPGGWGLFTQMATFNSALPNKVNEAMRPRRSCTGEKSSSDVSSSHL